MTFTATIRDKKGLGSSALYARITNATLSYWNFTTSTWTSSFTNSCKKFLIEYQDSDSLESRYSLSMVLPPGGPHIVEYVYEATGRVVAEETTGISVIQDGQQNLSANVTSIKSKTDVIPSNIATSSDVSDAISNIDLSGLNVEVNDTRLELLPTISERIAVLMGIGESVNAEVVIKYRDGSEVVIR